MNPLERDRRAPGMPIVRYLLGWMVARPLCALILTTLYHLRHRGRDHVPRTGPVLFVANHQSHFDPVIGGVFGADRPAAFFARSTLFSFKPFAALIAFFNAIPVNRERAGTETFRRSLAELHAGRALLVFPEGTRSVNGRVQPLKPGFLLLIKRAKAPVVPIAIEGAGDVWPRTRRFPRLRGRMLALAGPPIDPEMLVGLGEQGARDYIRHAIESLRLEARAELRRISRDWWPPPGPADQAYWETEGASGDASSEPPDRT